MNVFFGRKHKRMTQKRFLRRTLKQLRASTKRFLLICVFASAWAGIVHNGLGMYATWCTIAALFNLAHVLTYEEGIGLQQSIASTISLSVLMLELVVYVFVDNILLEK